MNNLLEVLGKIGEGKIVGISIVTSGISDILDEIENVSQNDFVEKFDNFQITEQEKLTIIENNDELLKLLTEEIEDVNRQITDLGETLRGKNYMEIEELTDELRRKISKKENAIRSEKEEVRIATLKKILRKKPGEDNEDKYGKLNELFKEFKGVNKEINRQVKIARKRIIKTSLAPSVKIRGKVKNGKPLNLKDFTEAEGLKHYSGAHFEGVDLKSVDLRGYDFSQVIFRNCEFGANKKEKEKEYFPESVSSSDFTGARFIDGTDISGRRFYSSKFEGAFIGRESLKKGGFEKLIKCSGRLLLELPNKNIIPVEISRTGQVQGLLF